MTKRLSWSEIRDHFSGQWVELTDCDWDWKETNPRYACVRNYSPSRKKLIGKVSKDSVIMYIGRGPSLLASYNDEPLSQAVGF